ncbi:helix-turn-helix domain-containing protein [Seongchinamella sediminis]|uniref:Helix-turn-helix domain-containing protein n=1 Tax=Seongchinamella sediminis TaxID=2283635 RepID=A0A3L7DUI2_9GAMM|nr:AraC family transcriptional regulator [Seongchinamella sediminis]RLQ20179.1 helix-turn-helix domain-containing protein [Seongchinamella sediminis]
MLSITIPARKFQLLISYLALFELDVEAIISTTGLTTDQIMSMPAEQQLPANYYSRIYKAAAIKLQQFSQPIIWGAGVGSESFEMMCYCLIGARTLGEALQLASRFERLLFSKNCYQTTLIEDKESSMVKLSFTLDLPEGGTPLVPSTWDRAGYTLTVARASGLRTWHALCGWLIGESIPVADLSIDAPPIDRKYRESLSRIFQCPVRFNAGENTFTFHQSLLKRRIVQTHESLVAFLNNSVYQLIEQDVVPASTSRAIRSLIVIELGTRMPSIGEVAAMLYISESTLRRRLHDEGTTYQAIKDEVRCELAIGRLLNEKLSIVEIAESLGYTESSTFVRSFKRWTGLSPSSYKRKYRPSITRETPHDKSS